MRQVSGPASSKNLLERVSVATVPLRQLVRRDERQKRRSDSFRPRAHDVHLRHSCRREQGLEDPEDPGEEAGDVDEELLRLRTVSTSRPGASGKGTRGRTRNSG